MAGREERLPPAIRNYVIFGLLFVVAIVLAAREHFGVEGGRGERDSALRLMIVGGSPALVSALDEVDGFSVLSLAPEQAIAAGRELLDDDDDDDAPYEAVLAHADQLGYGFVLFALRPDDSGDDDADKHGEPPAAVDEPRPAFAWGLSTRDEGIDALPGEDIVFVAFSVGDLAREGPRMNFAELAPVEFAANVEALDSARLALAEHPDFQALWQREGSAQELQARQVLTNRGWLERRASIQREQAAWAELDELWPTPGTISHSLAGDWEQVQAAPVPGGVLLEVRSARPFVGPYRKVRLALDDAASLAFVAQAALEDGQPDESRSRQTCAGLPETVTGQVVVAPDGASISVHDPTLDRAWVYAFDREAGAEGRCEVRPVATLTGYREAIGRPNQSGRIAWTKDDYLTWHEGQTSFSPFVSGLDAYSGPWWVDDTLLAMISERDQGPPSYGVAPVLTLFDTRRPHGQDGVPLAHEWTRADLDAGALFEPLGLAPGGESSTLLDLRTTGADELLLLTERCEDDAHRDLRPCVFRLRSSVALVELTTALAAAQREPAPGDEPDADAPDPDPAAPTELAPSFVVEQLGPIGPYLSLAVAAEGGRAAWVAWAGAANGDRDLFVADLHGPHALEPRRVDDDALADRTPRISADGRIVLSSVLVELGELGEIGVARAFVLPPAPAPAPPPKAPTDE